MKRYLEQITLPLFILAISVALFYKFNKDLEGRSPSSTSSPLKTFVDR